MKPSLLFAFIVTIGVASCAQTKIVAPENVGFFSQNTHGTIAVDDNGNPMGSATFLQYVVYIQTAAKVEPVWSKAWMNNETFDIAAIKVNREVIAGRKKANGETVKLTTKPGNVLWQLELQKGAGEPVPHKYKTSVLNSIVIKGTYNKKDVFYIVDNIAELMPVMYP